MSAKRADTNRPFDIFILGAGILSTLHFTRETIQALSVCDVVFVLHDDPTILDFVRSLGPITEDLLPLYEGQPDRALVYQAIADKVILAGRSGKLAGLLVSGNPMFLVSACEHIIDMARDAGLKVRCLPAVSSLDCILTELQIDLAYSLQIFDATTMLKENIQPNPRVPLLIFQLATLCNGATVSGDVPVSILQPLVEHLLSSYENDSCCYVLQCRSSIFDSFERTETTLSSLTKSKSVNLRYRPTLYVPATSQLV